jgi:hypothetical protein
MSAQAILQFDAHPADPRTGFEIGWDHAHYALVPPAAHLLEGDPVRQGWQAGCMTFGTRTLKPGRHVRKWLQVRLGAWKRGRAFEGFGVTPRFLALIDAAHCPITGEALTHGHGSASDASLDRVNNDAGYAVGNLAVMSTRANQAKGSLDWGDALERARRIDAGEIESIDGLGARHWERLGVLMAFCTPLAHEQAAALPLAVLPTPRLRVLNAAQSLQLTLTLQFTRPGHAQRVAELAALLPRAQARHDYLLFMHTLLAVRIAAGRLAAPDQLQQAMQRAWQQQTVLRRWRRLVAHLSQRDCEHMVRLAQRRQLAGPGLRWLEPGAATDGWALSSRGYAQSGRAPVDSDCAAALAPLRRPARSDLARPAATIT